MVSASRGADYDRDQARVIRLAQRDLNRFWLGIASLPPAQAKAALIDFAVGLVETYGPISATLAADFYDEARAQAGIRSRHSTTIADIPPTKQVSGSAAWASQPLFDGDTTTALTRILGVVQRHVQQAGRDTLYENGRRDRAKPRWARRPDSDPCKFCNKLASRGAVYLTAESAGEFNDWHDDCNCQPEMSFDGEVSYDVDAAYQRYIDDDSAVAGRSKSKSTEDPKRDVDEGASLASLKATLASLELSAKKFDSPGLEARRDELRRKIAARSK